MQIFYYLRGHLFLEALEKNVAYGNKNVFFLHIYIFFTTFAADYNLGKYGAIFIKK